LPVPRSRLRIVLALAAAMAASIGIAGARAPAPRPALDKARVEAFVDGAVAEAMRTDHIAGVTVAIVDRSGVVMTKGYGVASLDPSRPVGADTLFRIGSISKTATWISLMQLVEQGRVGLDDPINAHLPAALRIPDQGFSQPIRIRDLMTHSAGFEDSILGQIVHDPRRLEPFNAFLATHQPRRVREPGTLSVYSNYGAALGGAIVAEVSGQPWQDYAEQHVLRPLGMTTATYREPYSPALERSHGLVAPMAPGIAAHVSDGFDWRNGGFSTQPWEYVYDAAPAGAMSASAKDMAAYMRALLDPALMEKDGVLRASNALSLRSPLRSNAPGMGAWRHGFMDFDAALGRAAFGHDGDLIFQHASMVISPDDGLGVFVAVNTPTGLPLLAALPENFLDAFASPPRATPPRAADAKAEAAKVAGTYRTMRLPHFRTERAVMRLIASLDVAPLPDGDILLKSFEETRRYAPIAGPKGVFVYAATDGPGRIAFGEAQGRMRLYDPFSAAPAERIGFLSGPIWLLLALVMATFVAVWGVAAAVRRLFLRGEAGRAASVVLDGLCLVWLAALGLLATAFAPWLADQNTLVFDYPGPLFPLACWALLIAALATPVCAVAALGPLHPAWTWWRWTKQGAALAIFAALAVTLLTWGFLGYSGW
jgi:CubicO group peptidase (beta-lactamase class C family)